VTRALPYAAVFFAAAAWGTWGLAIRWTERIGSMPTALESAIVMAVLTLVGGIAALRDRVPRRASWGARAWVAWLGVSDALNVLLFFAAYKLTITVSVLTHYLAPVFVAIAAPLVLRERMTARSALAVALSFGGLALMLTHAGGAGLGPSSRVWTSAALGGSSALFYASNVLVNKFVIDSFSVSELMFWHGVVATPVLAAFVPRAAWAVVDLRAAVFLGLVSIVPGGLAGLSFVWGLRRMPATHASTLTLLEPLVSILLGAAFLGERLDTGAVLGAAGILGGALLVMVQAGRPPRYSRTARAQS
jgi:drug/metabolite transporter (DMT)-like permease